MASSTSRQEVESSRNSSRSGKASAAFAPMRPSARTHARRTSGSSFRKPARSTRRASFEARPSASFTASRRTAGTETSRARRSEATGRPGGLASQPATATPATTIQILGMRASTFLGGLFGIWSAKCRGKPENR
jgi:hypothetical protein